MLIAVRHARTSFNEDGKEKLRGWLPIPLSQEGKEEAIITAKKLKDLNYPTDSFYCSPLKRSVMSAQAIKDEIGMDYKTKNELKDWNTGIYTGKPVDSTLNNIHDYLNEPNVSIPEGESFKSFYNRDYPFLKKLIESDDCNLIVTHNRVVTLLKSLEKDGKNPNMGILKKRGPIEPSGIMMINPDWSIEIVYNPKDKTVGAT